MDNRIKMKKTFGDRAFSNAAPKIWNNLSLHFRNERNFNIFKKFVNERICTFINIICFRDY